MLLLLAALSCTPSGAYVHDGEERDFILHLPDDLPDGAPLVFFLHGLGGSARAVSGYGMRQQADAHGFGVVFPQGLDTPDGVPHWNAQMTLSDVDDMGFLTHLARDLQAAHGFDPDRTFIAGISNGGFMSYALACHRPDVFQAAGSIIGTMSGETWETCPEAPVPVFQISGTADTIVPMSGIPEGPGGWSGAPPIREVVDHWRAVNGCARTETEAVAGADQVGVRHTDCTDGADVVFFVDEGLRHRVPLWDWAGELSDFFLGLDGAMR